MLRIVFVSLFIIVLSSCASHEEESKNVEPRDDTVSSFVKEVVIEPSVDDSIIRLKGNGKSPGPDSSTNTSPVITGEPITTVAIDQQYDFQVNANDIDGDRLQFDILNKPGWLSFNRRYGTLSGVPVSTDVGVYENIIISVTDGIDYAALTPFSITVVAPTITNHSPEIMGSSINTNEDSSKVVSLSVTDSDGDLVELILTKAPLNGLVQLTKNSFDITYTPNSDYHGTDLFEITAVDSYGASSSAEFLVTIASINDVPSAQSDTVAILAGTAKTIDVLQNDKGLGDGSLKLEIQSLPSQGSVEINPDGTINYISNANPQASDSFTYKVSDVDNDSSVASVSITIDANCQTNCEAIVNAVWDANSETNIDGYYFYHGTVSGEYTNEVWVGNVTSFEYNISATGNHYFALKAQNDVGVLSGFSEEIVVTF